MKFTSDKASIRTAGLGEKFPTPKTLYDLRYQLKNLATDVRTTFGIDPKYVKYKGIIQQAAGSIDEAVKALEQIMDPDEQFDFAPHQFAEQDPEA